MINESIEPAVVRARVSRSLARLARAGFRLLRLRTELDEQLDGVRRRYRSRLESLRARSERLRAELESFCRDNRDCLLPSGRKRLTTPAGEVGFRLTEQAVTLRRGVDQQEACRRLSSAELADLVRTRRAPDKPSVRRALREGRVSARQLRQCGLELLPATERFYCKVRHDSPVESVAAGEVGR